jgi:hypothetical protein
MVHTPPAIFNTPSKLEHFLQAAERNGIPGVILYHAMLLEKGYGLDIMHLVNITDLIDIGMPPGDAICLEDYAVKWWTDKHRCVAKHPRGVESSQTIPPLADSTPLSKCLRFKKCFNDGGATRLMGLMSCQAAVKTQTTHGGCIPKSWICLFLFR